jgi:hypothetical protein
MSKRHTPRTADARPPSFPTHPLSPAGKRSARRHSTPRAFTVGMGSALVLGLAALSFTLLSCGGGHTPPPVPPPTPPPAPTCPPSQGALGPLCSPPDLVTGCYHQPPGEECQFIPATPPVEPVPPAPPGACVPPHAESPDWGVPVPPSARPFTAAIRNALLEGQAQLGDACGKDALQSLDALGAYMRARGYCAGRSVDSVAVLAPDELWEEYHAVYFGNGCWVTGPGAYKNAWPFNGDNPGGGTQPPPPVEPPTPPPNPPTTDACGTPEPPPLDRWKAHRVGSRYTATPLVYSPGGEFCRSIGLLNPDGVSGRQHCPPRAEGHPERVPCERQIIGAPGPPSDPVWTWDAPVSCWVEDNPFNFKCQGGVAPTWVQVCNAPGTICKRLDANGVLNDLGGYLWRTATVSGGSTWSRSVSTSSSSSSQ